MVKRSSNILIVCIIMILSIDVTAQTSELEILGLKKEPFYLKIFGEMQEGSPGIRFHIPDLDSGAVPVEIVFADTNLITLDTILLIEQNHRMVYRIARAPRFPADLFRFFKKIFGKDTIESNTAPPIRELRFLEKTLIYQESNPEGEEQNSGKDTPELILKHDDTFTFIREQPNPSSPIQQDTVISSSSETSQTPDSLSGKLQNNDTIKTTYTTTQHQQLLKQLKSLTFEEERKTLVTQTLYQVSVTTQQLLDILQTFDFERTKMELCKKYYFYITDTENAHLLSGAFEFVSSQTEIKQWIHEQRK